MLLMNCKRWLCEVQRARGETVAQIVAKGLVKTFRVGKRQAGLLNALKGVVKREHVLVRALDGVSFEISEGELVGYLGPNGAGKSTTVKILSGILVPDGGSCEVLGRVPWRDRINHVRHIGVVFGQRSQLWWDLPVIDSFELLRDIYKLTSSDYKTVRDELVASLQLESLLEVPVRQLSLGQRMRCELAASLLHRPRILFLDEPTIGLDAVSKLAVRNFIKQVNKEYGTTVILTTHDMDDVEALCSRVMMIGRGKILAQGTLKELCQQVVRERRLIVEIEGEFSQGDVASRIQDAKLVKWEAHVAHFNFDPAKISPAELVQQVSTQFSVRDLLIEDPPIDEVISRLYGEYQL